MKKPFCLFLKNQVRFSYDQYSPCCWIQKSLDIKNCSADEFSEYHKWLNQIDNWVPECNFCQAAEAKGDMSWRQRVEKYPHILGIHNEEDVGELTSMEFQIDTNCNAACLICGPHNSTTWQKYNISNIKNKSTVKQNIDQRASESTKLKYDRIRELVNFSTINQVVFLGGEPLEADLHKQVITDIQQHKSLKDLSARYITNGSRRPDTETVELWRQLKSIRIVFSIDGISEHFNYLRWPLQWNQVESNIKYFIDLNIPGMTFGISSAVNPFNIFYYDQYIAWEKEMFGTEDKFLSSFEAGGVINNSSIPEKLQDVIKKKYADVPWLLNRMRDFDLDKYNKFIKYIELHDIKREINWKEIFPEIVQYFI